MTCGTPSLGSRQDPAPVCDRGRILAPPADAWPRRRRTEMVDLGYALVLVGGFAVLLLTLRGLQRL
jgi:hypothetical protein